MIFFCIFFLWMKYNEDLRSNPGIWSYISLLLTSATSWGLKVNIVSTASQSLGSVFECARNKNPYNALFHSLEDPLYLSNCVPTAPSNLRQKRRKNIFKIYLHKKTNNSPCIMQQPLSLLSALYIINASNSRERRAMELFIFF